MRPILVRLAFTDAVYFWAYSRNIWPCVLGCHWPPAFVGAGVRWLSDAVDITLTLSFSFGPFPFSGLQVVPLLEQARRLRDDCGRLEVEAIQRPEDRPGFHALFRDVHAFARGVGSPGRVTSLARSLARFIGVADEVSGGDAQGNQNAKGRGKNKAVDRAGLLQEEAVWQGAAGAFVSRCRSEYGEAYVDVVTGITEAVEVTRLGLRVLAAACASSPTPAGRSEAVSVHPLARLQGLLLSFPYPCCEGLTAVGGGDCDGDGTHEDLGESFQVALGPSGLEAAAGAGNSGVVYGTQHVMLLQVRWCCLLMFHACLAGGLIFVFCCTCMIEDSDLLYICT